MGGLDARLEPLNTIEPKPPLRFEPKGLLRQHGEDAFIGRLDDGFGGDGEAKVGIVPVVGVRVAAFLPSLQLVEGRLQQLAVGMNGVLAVDLCDDSGTLHDAQPPGLRVGAGKRAGQSDGLAKRTPLVHDLMQGSRPRWGKWINCEKYGKPLQVYSMF